MCDHVFVRLNSSASSLHGKISNCLKCNEDYYKVLINHKSDNIEMENKLFDETNGNVPDEFYQIPICHTCIWDSNTLRCCQVIKYPDNNGKNYGYEVKDGYIRSHIPERTKCNKQPSSETIRLIERI